jgi:hypothetical protein
MNKAWQRIKASVQHTWKYHKSSSFLYLYGISLLLLMTYIGGQAIKLKIALPDYVLTGFVGIIMGYIACRSLTRMGDMVNEKEEKKFASLTVTGDKEK